MDIDGPKVVNLLAPSTPGESRNYRAKYSKNHNFYSKSALRTRWHGSCFDSGAGVISMRVATAPTAGRIRAQTPGPAGVTLLELVSAICDITDDEEEILATVYHLLESGTVRLCGNLRGVDPKTLR